MPLGFAKEGGGGFGLRTSAGLALGWQDEGGTFPVTWITPEGQFAVISLFITDAARGGL